MKLYIGGKWSSTWTMRGWLACKLSGLDFDTETIFLSREDSREKLEAVSPTGRIPVLLHDGQRITDTWAIAEYLWELAPDSDLWPRDRRTRTAARMIAGEMHGHFFELRYSLQMNLVKRWPIANGIPSNVKLLDKPGVRDQVARVQKIWRTTRADWGAGGPYLFGERFCFADAMYAPMASRFRTYSVETDPVSAAYIEACLDHAYVREWILGAEEQARELGWDAVAAWP